jgi:hypothetical protein
VCLASVRLYHWNIQHLTPAQRTPEVCLAAVQQDGYAIEYLTPQERTPEICLVALKVSITEPNSSSCIQYLTLEECTRPLVCEWIREHWDELEQKLLKSMDSYGDHFLPEFAESIREDKEKWLAQFNRIRCALGEEEGLNRVSRLDEIDKRIEQLRKRKQKLLARESVKARSLLTRQSVILGNWLMSNRPDLVEQIKAQLTKPQDRAPFGLEEPS